MPDNQHNIDTKIHQFKVKFIKKKLLEGSVLFVGIIIVVYLTISGIEAVGRFNSLGRGLLLGSFIIICFSLLYLRVIKPLGQFFRAEAAVADEDAAVNIGNYFPELGDKLLNYIQLSSTIFADNSLAKASLDQRAGEMGAYSFTEAVSYNTEKRNLIRYILPIVAILILLVSLFPTSFIGSSKRIVQFNKAFVPQAPFTFDLSENLIAFRNENYLLSVNLKGEALPQEAYLVSDGRKTKLQTAGIGSFELLFSNIRSSRTFYIEAASFKSKEFTLEVVDRPSLSNFSVNLTYPRYLKLPNEKFENIGSFEVPEGTEVSWKINSKFTEQLIFVFDDDSTALEPDSDIINYSKQVFANTSYGLQLNNSKGKQQGTIEYKIDVIKDRSPQIEVKLLPDTILYSYVAFAGNLSDDHGIRSLHLHYSKNSSTKGTINIPIDKGVTSQSLFHQWLLDSLYLEAGDQVQFYLQVTDNDVVNKYKSSRSKVFYLTVPDEAEAMALLEESKEKTKEQISDASHEAKELKENIDKLVEDLKGKKELTWQEEQMLENLVEQKQKLEEQIKKLQDENKMLNQQQKQFSSPSEEILEKQEKLQDLLDELMDEDTKKMYEELQKLLESRENSESVQDLLQKMQNKELNLEQELDRAMEFFKQIEFEQKLEQAKQNLNEIIEEQEELIAQTEEKSNPLDSLAEDQGKLNEKFNEFQEELRDAKEKNQELKRPNSMEDTSGDEEEVNKEQNDAKENLKQNKRKESKTSQKNAKDKMEQLGKKLETMQSSMQMEQMQEDLGNLQSILSNLIEMSFDQEQLMADLKQVNQSDPAFVVLSQEQLTLKEDSKIINDSLIALSSRVMAIASFVTRELNEMNQHMDTSIEAIRERKKSDAAVAQQLTMTSANNLALMLDNVMRQMQESMASSMGKGAKEDGSDQMPGLSEMQKKLNEQVRELSQSGKSGRELSEELAKLAAEQERIRKAMEEAGKKFGGEPGDIDQMSQQMEKTEMDLVNKKLNRQTLQRQQQILTRMLEAEKSMRERELDSKREAKSATQYEKMLPKAFDEYVKQREKEIELLKTVPPRLVPFFKIEVGDYFERVKQQNKTINN